MGRGSSYPQITCPGCSRQVRVGPSSERTYPHNQTGGGECPQSGERIDLYGTDPVTEVTRRG